GSVQLLDENNGAGAASQCDAGQEVRTNGARITLKKRVRLGHNVALVPIKKREAVYKYGQIIGFAGQDIAPGDHVHVHNVAADAFERDYAFCRDCPPPPTPAEPRPFLGYDRGGGRIGTRKYI